MRAPRSIAFVGLGFLMAACADSATEPTSNVNALVDTEASLAVRTGEVFSRTAINGLTSRSLTVGSTLQLSNTLYYSLGGTLSGIPYSSWRSTDPCVVTVTSASPSWGNLKGISAGSAKVIATAFGKSDTVSVTVTGDGNLDSKCSNVIEPLPSSNYSMGTPATRYGTKAGEKPTRIVLFAPPSPLAVGTKQKLVAEMWYSAGGKLLANTYVTFETTDGAIATVVTGSGATNGTVTARKVGAARIIARLGQFADTVMVRVTR
jgi:hypothetical protein